MDSVNYKIPALLRSVKIACLFALATLGWSLSISYVSISYTYGAPRPKGVYLAERDANGAVHIVLRQGNLETPVVSELDGTEWTPFGLRGLPGTRADGAGAVEELGLGDATDLPRIRVRGDFQIVAFKNIVGEGAGLAAIGSWGAKVLLYSLDGRFELRQGGATLSPDERFLGLVCHGLELEEIFVVDLSGPVPGVREVLVGEQIASIEPQSLTLTNSHAFFSSLLNTREWVVSRAALEPANPVDSERFAGPFLEVGPCMAFSKASVVFLAGEKNDFWDAYVAGGTGAAVNVTQNPAAILPHSPVSARLAISEDGEKIAYSVRVIGVPETYWHDVLTPGPAGEVYLTGDDRFNPYIDQESWVFFDPSGNLMFTAGHTPVTLDLYRVNTTLLDNTINLTRTGSASFGPPFDTTGTLNVQSIVLAAEGVVMVSATGFPDGSAGLLGIHVSDGTVAFSLPGVQGAAQFFSIGADIYFSATRPQGNRGLFLLRSASISEIANVPLGSEPRLLVRGNDRAIVLLPGTGLFELEAGLGSHLLVAASDMAPSIALDLTGSFLVFGRASPTGDQYFILNIATGTETFFFEVPPGAATLAISDLPDIFLRGDSNSDKQVDISDAVATLFSLFLGAQSPFCPDAADADDDGALTISDVVRTLLYLFKGGEPLPPPSAGLGIDPTPDDLGCR